MISEDLKDYIQENEWHHVAFVFHDYDKVKFYIDGKLNDDEIKFDRIDYREGKNIQVRISSP